MIRRLFTLSALCLAPGWATAQLATSTNFQVDALTLDGSGGGQCSGGFAAVSDQGWIGDASPSLSTGFQAEVGFLTLHDPLDTDQPAIFAVSPDFGPDTGATPITICGIHFDRAGAAAPVTVDIDGTPATSVVVVSDSTITALSPAGAMGPNDAVVTTSLGVSNDVGGFVHTPALTASPRAFANGGLTFRNYGVAGGTFQTWTSVATANLPLPPFGTILISPTPSALLFSGAYPGPDGVQESTFTVPPSLSLFGSTIYFQSAAILSLAPLDLRLVNRAETLLLN